MITKHNYEEYALDYLEGKLSVVEIAAMHAFLAKYPEVREELNNFSLMPLIADENLVFGNKTALMKPANAAPKVVALPLYASYYRAVAVAAGVVLMLGAGVYFYKNNFNIAVKGGNFAAETAKNPKSSDNNSTNIPASNFDKNDNDMNNALAILPKEMMDKSRKSKENQVNPTVSEENKKNNAPIVTFANAAAINKQKNIVNSVKKEIEKNNQVPVTFVEMYAINKQAETKTEIILQNTNNKNANDGNANSMETVALLPTVNTIQDFYFETEENTDLIADNFSQEYATTQTKSTPRAKNSALKTLAPEGSFDKRETKFWDAFVPSTRNNDNDRTTAFLDSFKPAAYSK